MSLRLKSKTKLNYSGLHHSSTASELEIMEWRSIRKRKDVYQAEETLAEKRIGKRTFYLIKWLGWGSEDATWEPACNILDAAIIQFWECPAPEMRQVSFYVERLLSCFEASLKERLRSVKQLDFPVSIFRFLFNGRGLDKKRGYKSLNKDDFDPQWFPKDWHTGLINKRGTKTMIRFPIVMRSFLSKSPKLFQKQKSGEILERKRRIIQRITVTIVKDTFNSY
uniref:Chromo domain-containing protein n=1 Tax=Clytia hemisphaerica TaxID=252671 RepID=A0A7M5UMW5_9CNID|eukprot:TCONS_00067730-protein